MIRIETRVHLTDLCFRWWWSKTLREAIPKSWQTGLIWKVAQMNCFQKMFERCGQKRLRLDICDDIMIIKWWCDELMIIIYAARIMSAGGRLNSLSSCPQGCNNVTLLLRRSASGWKRETCPGLIFGFYLTAFVDVDDNADVLLLICFKKTYCPCPMGLWTTC